MKFLIIIFSLILFVLVITNKYEFFTSFGDIAWNQTKNCYSYALNNTDNRPWKQQQPGYISGKQEYSSISNKDYNCKHLIERLKQDLPNAKLVACNNACPKGMRKIAMAVDPNKDYHFYRNDIDGWSHKRGNLEPERLPNDEVPWLTKYQYDNSDYKYTDFCSCFCIV